jgi:threonine 3-dehydrogenase
MKALVKERPERGFTLKEVPIPEDLRDDEVLVKVKYASICGTDLHIYEWNEWSQNRIKTPQIGGHEFSGEVVKIGKNVKLVKEGDFVSAETHIPCTVCKQCRTGNMHICKDMEILGVDRDGIFAEYARVPEVVLWKNDPDMPQHMASVQEPLGNAVYTATSGNITGKSVLITGAGPIGVMAIQVAHAVGAGPVIVSEVKDYRLELAKKNGADFIVNPAKEDAYAKIMEITNGEGVDAVLEMSGNESAFNLGIKSVMPGGHISILGVFNSTVDLNINEAIFKNITMYGITGRKMFDTWYTLSSLLNTKKIDLDKIITDVIPFENWQEGFDKMEAGTCGKVVLKI